MKDLSIVIPVFNNVDTIERLYLQLEDALRSLNLTWEVIFVNDGSLDNSWNIINQLSSDKENIKGLGLSRNFGQHQAIVAGIDNAFGNYIVIMDCDLQDAPNDIEKLVRAAEKGYDIVYTKRKKRKHDFLKSILTVIYKKIFRFISNKDYSFEYGSLVLFNQQVAREFRRFKEGHRLYLQSLIWLGFNSTELTVEHQKRNSGRSSYTFSKLFNLAIDGLLFNSDRPLKIVMFLGLGTSIFSIMIAVYLVAIALGNSHFQTGWPSLIVTLLFSTGLVLFSVGVVGMYIGRIFIEIKGRPIYIVKETVNVDEKE